jgi:hypothetical protein
MEYGKGKTTRVLCLSRLLRAASFLLLSSGPCRRRRRRRRRRWSLQRPHPPLLPHAMFRKKKAGVRERPGCIPPLASSPDPTYCQPNRSTTTRLFHTLSRDGGRLTRSPPPSPPSPPLLLPPPPKTKSKKPTNHPDPISLFLDDVDRLAHQHEVVVRLQRLEISRHLLRRKRRRRTPLDRQLFSIVVG